MISLTASYRASYQIKGSAASVDVLEKCLRTDYEIDAKGIISFARHKKGL